MTGLLKAAKKGDVSIQSLLGTMYFRGIGVEQDYNEAMHWYRQAGIRGHAFSQFRLGLMFLRGTGVACDLAEADHWIQKAVKQNYVSAKLYIGINGKGKAVCSR